MRNLTIQHGPDRVPRRASFESQISHSKHLALGDWIHLDSDCLVLMRKYQNELISSDWICIPGGLCRIGNAVLRKLILDGHRQTIEMLR